jgi:uncharacterized membrane protein
MPSRSINELFWAFVVALVLASLLASIGYIYPGSDTARHDMFSIASAMVTGALGFFAGRASTIQRDPPSAPTPGGGK